MKKSILLTTFFVISTAFVSNFSFACDDNDTFCKDGMKPISVAPLLNDGKTEVVGKFTEITDKNELKSYKNFWKNEIATGGETGKFYAYSYPLKDGSKMVISQMKTKLTCDTLGGKECKVKFTILKKDNNYQNIMDEIYIDSQKEKIFLINNDKNIIPDIQVWDLKFSFDNEKKYYSLAIDSKKPETYEVLDPRGFDPKNPKSDVHPNGSSFLYKLGEMVASFSIISKAYAGTCANGMVLPSTAKISSPFGGRYINGIYSNHKGIDYSVGYGTPLPSIAEGTVIEAKGGCEPNGGYYQNPCNGQLGNYVKIRLTNGDVITYGHLSTISVSNGQSVGAGTLIGNSGNSGSSTGAHLHFAVDVNGVKVDPATYLSSCGATAWDGSGAAATDSGSTTDKTKDDSTRFQVENLPWYTGGDDTLSDERYNELFGDTESCDSK